MSGKFDLKKTESGKFMFNLCAANGQVVLTSQQYKDKTAAQGGIKSVQQNCSDDACFERKTSSSEQPYFTLKARNGQVVGQSQMYKSTSAMENGIKSVQTNAPTASLNDLTS